MSPLFVVNFLFLCSCTTGSILQALQHTTQKLAVPVSGACLHPASSKSPWCSRSQKLSEGAFLTGLGTLGSEVVFANRRLL